MLMLSLVIVIINFILNRIIYALVDLRRYKTKTLRGRFLIINIFIVYFINTALLILLVRAEFDGYSLKRIIEAIVPENIVRFNI